MSMIRKHADEIDMLGLTPEHLERLLDFILNHNYFKFNGKVYRQLQGVAMGNALAPPLAIAFMGCLEERILQTAEVVPKLYGRFIDDCLAIWTAGREALTKFLDLCNSIHPSIKFTPESTCDGNAVPFMDTIFNVVDGKISFQLYRKPTDSNVNINYNSALPGHVKQAVAVEHFRRAVRLSSSTTEEGLSKDRISELLQKNDFPPLAISRAEERSSLKTPKKPWKKPGEVILKLPYRSDALSARINKYITKSKLPFKIVYEHCPNIKDMVVRSALNPAICSVSEQIEQASCAKPRRGRPRKQCMSCQAGLNQTECDTAGVVYSVKCAICKQEYIGETLRCPRERFKEHQEQGRNRRLAHPFGKHMAEQHPDTKLTTSSESVLSEARILARETRSSRRFIREAIEIRDAKPAINTNGGWQLD